MNWLRRLFRRKAEVLTPEKLSHDERAWQRNQFPRFKHFSSY